MSAEPFALGPYERIGIAISTLARGRELLNSSLEDALGRAVEKGVTNPYAFAAGVLRANQDLARFVLEDLWGDLVSIERELMPAEVE